MRSSMKDLDWLPTSRFSGMSGTAMPWKRATRMSRSQSKSL